MNLEHSIRPVGSVLIVDYGSQLTQLIARRVRELGIYSEVVSYDTDFSRISFKEYCAFIISGSDMSVNDPDSGSLPSVLLEESKPLLCICYGAQRLVHECGGTVESSLKREFGVSQLVLSSEASDIFTDWPHRSEVLMSHSDHITELPPNYEPLAYTDQGVLAAYRHINKPYYAVQFHPEAEDTAYGKLLFSNFLFKVSSLTVNWSMEYYLEKEIQCIRNIVGTRAVLLGLSGGVDSLVSAVMLHRAIGAQLHCVFVDHGFMRLDEAKQTQAYIKAFGFSFIQVDAKDSFFKALAGITDPETKRKTVGKLFVDTFLEVAKNQINQHEITFLAQGTIYSDVIESAGSGKSKLIKSHHNVGGLPADLSLELLEPLRYLFKDEVRALGLSLGIDKLQVMRHPFPGPGLSIRIVGEVTPLYVEIVQKADFIMLEELHKSCMYEAVSQAFCIFAPIKSVGIKGDSRSYDYTIIVRVVRSEDFMTARFAQLPWSVLERIGARIVNEVEHVGRVLYDITSKPPATIEWE